jgi:hybrid cluster-associated redox disulfide protein
MPPAPITAATIVDTLMTEHPATIPVFLRHHAHCVGCPVGSLHTVADACREHGVPLETLLRDLNAAVSR